MPEVSSPNQPEQGFLHRARWWRDLFPWLAIVDSLRGATTVVSLTLISLAIFGAVQSERFLNRPEGTVQESNVNGKSIDATTSPETLQRPMRELGELSWVGSLAPGTTRLVFGPMIRLLRGVRDFPGMLWLLLHQAILIGIWIIPAGFMIRQSGLAMAGRMWMGTWPTLKFVARRSPGYLGVVLLPFIFLAMVAGYFWVASMLRGITVVGPWMAGLMSLLGLPLAITAGLVGFGGFLAVPLGWGAISLERESSGFDGASRGYEYILRRPIQSFFYCVIGAAVMWLLVAIAGGVGRVATMMVSPGFETVAQTSVFQFPKIDNTEAIAPMQHTPNWFTSSANRSGEPTLTLVRFIPLVAELAVFWSLVAWMYLLLRRSTNHQEIEDLWEPPIAAPPSLPALNVGDTGSIDPQSV